MSPRNAATPPLSLETHFYTKMSFVAAGGANINEINPDDLKDISLQTQAPTILQNDKDNDLYQVVLSINTVDDGTLKAYALDVQIVGFFRVEHGIPEEMRGGLLAILAPSMLYGAAREFICTVTSRGPFPPLYLPTISFVPSDSSSEVPGEAQAKPRRSKKSKE